ncbi:MAG: hypothetical protein ACRD2L_06200 [Terriglobia bacterium]
MAGRALADWPVGSDMLYLSSGEQQAIQMAEQLRADAILIDDKQGEPEQRSGTSLSLELSVFWQLPTPRLPPRSSRSRIDVRN